MPEKDLNIEQVPVQRSTTTVLQHPSEIDVRKQAKQRVTQEHEEAMEKIRNRPDPDLPDWFHTLLYNLNTEDPIQNAWANNLFRSQYDKRYNEYLEQHPVSKRADAIHAATSGPAFPGDATFSNFSMSPSHLNEEDAYKYAVEKSWYDPGNPNDFWRHFDKENDKIKTIGAAAAVGLPLMYTIGAGGFGIIPKTLMDLSFGYSSYKNFTGPEGWRKTLNLLKNGKYGKAALSGLGDMVNISLMSPIAKEMIKPIKNFGKEIFDVAKFNYINRGNRFRMDYPWQHTPSTIRLNPESQISIYNPAQITGHFGNVKYYGPTMGKTTAAAVNSKLVDFDDIIRQPSRNILDRYGFKSKSEMYNSGNQEAIKAYEDMLVKTLQDWRANPINSNLTLVASPTAIANPANTGFYFDNIPSIPSRDVFIARNVGRGGTPEASALWYDSLIRKNPNLKIDNRFVSQIEKQPYQSPTVSQLEIVPQRAFASDFSGVENIEPENFGYGGVRPNLGLRKLRTERKAWQLLNSAAEEQKRNTAALNQYSKNWEDLTYTQQYWLKVYHGNEWNDKLIVPRNKQ